MTYETLSVTLSDAVAEVTFCMPDQGNALSLKMAEELYEVAIAAEQDPAVRAVLLTGEGRMFCAGGNLKNFIAAGDAVATLVERMTRHLHAAISVFARMDAVVICAVNGVAAGAGFSIAAQCDYVIAADKASFTMAYTAAGLAPDGSSTWFLPRLIGLRRARELMLTNRRLSAAEALDYGLIDRVVDGDDLMTVAREQARVFAAGPVGAYGKVKALLATSFQESLERQMELESRAIMDQAESPEGREGVAAFAEKRKPDFLASR